MHSTFRFLRLAALITLAAFALLASLRAPVAHAGTYWWSGTPAGGSNGFSWSFSDAPYWNPWGGSGRCESRGTTIPAGNPCILVWHVPTGLDARAGSIGGTYKHANPAFEQHNVVECNGTTVLQGTSTIKSFTRSWPDMCSYLSISLHTPAAPATVSAASQFFDATTFSIELIDVHSPSLVALSGHSGWRGAGGTCVRYAFSETGSGLVAASLVNATTGQVIDAPTWPADGIVSGVGSVDRTPCMGAPGTGTYTMRARATDRSGNVSSHDLQLAFDVTPPVIGTPRIDGADLTDGYERRGSVASYRPAFSVAASDGHSGLASVQVLLDGSLVAGAASWQPGDDLSTGAHTITFRATDAVGNQSSITRTFTIVDDVAPTLSISSPTSSGGPEPVLDVAATDDLSGLETATWTVLVNGRVLVASSATWRLQADVGYLVDGTHELRVTIADRSGNVATETLSYVANSGDDQPDPPGLNGLYLMQVPTRVEEGSTQHVRAIAVQDGRPVSGTFELRSGDRVLASADAARSGQVDLDAVVDAAGPLVLHPPRGSALEPASFSYEFIAAPIDPCVAAPLSPACVDAGDPSGAGGAGGGQQPASTSTTIIQIPVPAAAAPAAVTGGGAPSALDAQAPYPRNVVYYVGGVPYWNGLPLAESGAARDRVPPRWTLRARPERAGMVRRTSRLALRLWTSEMSVVSITPSGAKRRYSVNPRRKLRTIHVRIDRRSMLGRRIARARAGAMLTVKLRVVATDRNENASRPRTIRLRIRV